MPAVAAWAAGQPLVRPGWGGGGFWNPVTGSVFFTYTVSEGAPPPPLAGQPPYPLLDETTYAPGYGALREGGSTFEVQRIPGITWPNGTEDPRIGPGVVDGAADGAGNIYLTWAESVDGEVRIRLTASGDDGRTWREPILVDSAGGTAIYPTIAATAAGHVAVAYYETPAGGHPESVPADASWNVTLAWTLDALEDEPGFQRGTLSLRTLHKGPICTGGIISCDVEGAGRTLLEFFDIQPMPDGRIAGVWASDLEVADRTVNVFGVTREPLLGPETGG